MRQWVLGFACSLPLLCAGDAYAATRDLTDLAAEVRRAEISFAKTMADRDLKAFGMFIADEGVFWGSKGPLRGRDAVVADWKRFFEKPEGPFSWQPEPLEVPPPGTHGQTNAPIDDRSRKLIGTCTTICRLGAGRQGPLVFDRPCDVCHPEKRP